MPSRQNSKGSPQNPFHQFVWLEIHILAPFFSFIQHLFKSQPNYKKSFRARECFGGKCGKGNNLTICWCKRSRDNKKKKERTKAVASKWAWPVSYVQNLKNFPHLPTMQMQSQHRCATCWPRRFIVANRVARGREKWPTAMMMVNSDGPVTWPRQKDQEPHACPRWWCQIADRQSQQSRPTGIFLRLLTVFHYEKLMIRFKWRYKFNVNNLAYKTKNQSSIQIF